jgi:hypothetical protein
MRRLVAVGALTVGSLGLGGAGAYTFNKGMEASQHIAKANPNPEDNRFYTTINAQEAAVHSLVDGLAGIVVAGAGAGALILTGIEVQRQSKEP